MAKTFTELLRSAVDRSGKTASAIGREAGISRQHMSLLLSGKRVGPDWLTVCKLARALGVPTDYFRAD